MPGHAMSGYVTVPSGWQKKPEEARAWIRVALTWSKALPAKGAKVKKSAAAAKKTVKAAKTTKAAKKTGR
jgi:hypothetical protein